jgi:hypothetical protein
MNGNKNYPCNLEIHIIFPSCVILTLSKLRLINWHYGRVKWVPVTMSWRVLSLRMEERPAIWRVAANTLNKQSLTGDKVWSCSLGVGRGAFISSPSKRILLRNVQTKSLGPGLTFWHDISHGKGTWDLILGMLGTCVGLFTYSSSSQGINKILIRFSGCEGCYVGERGHGKSRGL